jgi:hypothetical protein
MVKQRIILLLFIALFVQTIGVAQNQGNGKQTKNSLSFDYSQFIFNANLNLNYERYFKNKNSIQLSAGYLFNGVNPNDINRKLNGFKTEIQYRKHLFYNEGNNYFNRFYAGLYGGYQFLKFEYYEIIWEYIGNNYYEVEYYRLNHFNSINGGFVLGYDIFVGNRFLIDIFGGFGLRITPRVFNYTPIENYYYSRYFGTVINPYYAGILPKLGIKLGYRF